jgi:hypothetical protein
MFSLIDRYFGWISSGNPLRLATLLAPLAVVGIAVVALSSSSEPSSPSSPAPGIEAAVDAQPTARPTVLFQPTATPGPLLALQSSSCTRDRFGYMSCEGFVQNISSRPLDGVMTVVIWYDANNVPQSEDTSFVDYQPILPGQSSPWSTFGRANPALNSFRVQFKEFAGGTIRYRDDRPQ